jgi:hypothetical protein
VAALREGVSVAASTAVALEELATEFEVDIPLFLAPSAG